MNCKNTITEYNVQRECWFPINKSSPFQLCTRCDFYKTEEILRDAEAINLYKDNQKFLRLCAEKNHKESLLSALVLLKEKNIDFFESFYKSVLTPSLENFLSYEIYSHTSSRRCVLYKYIAKNRIILRDIVYTDLPWKCWDCLAYLLRQKTMDRYYRSFAKGILMNKLSPMEQSKEHLLDVMVSLKLIQKDHAIRILFDIYSREVRNEEKAKNLLMEFFSQPCCIREITPAKISEFIPSAWNRDNFLKNLQKYSLQYIRKRNWCFKEELMMRTWAPERLFPWCFDLEELKDFDPM